MCHTTDRNKVLLINLNIWQDNEQMRTGKSVSLFDAMIRKWVRVSPQRCVATSLLKITAHFFRCALSVQSWLTVGDIFFWCSQYAVMYWSLAHSYVVTRKGFVCIALRYWSISCPRNNVISVWAGLKQPTLSCTFAGVTQRVFPSSAGGLLGISFQLTMFTSQFTITPTVINIFY